MLDLGRKPDIPLSEWKLTIGGFVGESFTWTWEAVSASSSSRTSTTSLVTSWSRFDNEWEGVSY